MVLCSSISTMDNTWLHKVVVDQLLVGCLASSGFSEGSQGNTLKNSERPL